MIFCFVEMDEEETDDTVECPVERTMFLFEMKSRKHAADTIGIR